MKRLALVSAALLALLAAGCGGSSDSTPDVTVGQLLKPSTQRIVADAASKTADAGTLRTTFTLTMTGLTAEPVEMVGEGAFDSEHRRGRMTFDLSALGKASGGQDLGEVEMVFDKLVVYMRWPFLQNLSPTVKEWVKFDLQALGQQQGFDLGQLSQLQQSDPSQALVYLRAAGDDVRRLGEEEVRGVRTTHYRMTVDLEKVAKVAPPEQRAQVQASIDEIIAKSGVREVPTEVWIDEDGLVRRQKLEYRDFQFAPGQKGDMTMTTELFDFGVEMHVEPPPADKVTDIQQLIGAGS